MLLQSLSIFMVSKSFCINFHICSIISLGNILKPKEDNLKNKDIPYSALKGTKNSTWKGKEGAKNGLRY